MTTVVTAATFLALYMDDLRLAFTDAVSAYPAKENFPLTIIFFFAPFLRVPIPLSV